MNTKLRTDELGRVDSATFKALPKKPIHVILDSVRSAQNVGSIFRSMDAFRCTKLWLCGISPSPPHKEINKTALGSTHTVDWEYTTNTIAVVELLKKQKVRVLAVEQARDSVFLNDFENVEIEGVAFVFGNEINGVRQEVIDICDGCVEIEQHGTKHSLNVSVCAGIVLWHATRCVPFKLS